MKQKLLNSLRLRVCALVAMVLCATGSAWGDTATFDFDTNAGSDFGITGTSSSSSTAGDITSTVSATISGVTVTISPVSSGTNNRFWNSSPKLRLYGGSMTVDAGSNNIQSIAFTTANGKFSASVSTGSVSGSGTSYSWAPAANSTVSSVVFTITGNTQIKSFVVTYGSGTPTPTTYTVTYNANGGTGSMTDNNSYEEDDEVTLLTNTFTAPEGMMWDSWEVKDADDNSITVTSNIFSMPASNVTVTAQWVVDPNATQYNWVETDLASLTSSDIFVIVGNDTYAMASTLVSNTQPSAIAVTIAEGKISGIVSDNLRWNVTGNSTDGYIFHPNDDATNYLYCNTTASTGSNTNMRIGTQNNNIRNLFVLSDNHLVTKDSYTARYIHLNGSTDWRGYVSKSTSSTTVKFYKRVDANATIPPSISAENVNIAYNATSGSITFTVNNPVEGGSVTATKESGDWLTVGTPSNGSVALTCSANSETTARTATVTLTYTYNNETVTKEVTVTQAAAPVVYSTIPALFAAATTTATDALVTFDSWVVSGISTDGKNVFVTDNNGNGFVIYSSSDQSGTYSAGNILSGTAVSCKLQKYNGFAEVKNLDSSDLTITTGGTVSTANVAMASLAGVNTGALVSYENLTCSITDSKYYLSDGTTTLQVYNSLFAFDALTAGKTYNITGIYQQYNNNKEILPRSAADIDEVQVQHNEYTLTVSNLSHVDLYVFYANDETNPIISGEGSAQVLDGTQVLVSVDVESGYDLESLIVDDNNVTSEIEADAYTFTMPTHAVTITATATASSVTPVVNGSWVAANITDLNANDVFVIVGDNGDTYAMSNDNGTSSPSAVGVEVSGSTLSGTIADNIKWNISGNATDGYTFYPNGSTESWLYCTNSNTGVKVGTGDAKHFTLEDGYLTTTETDDQRYIGIYNSAADWRCYKKTAEGAMATNIAGQTFTFYKKLAAKLNSNGYATFSSTVAIDYSQATDFTAWAVASISGTTITFNQITGAVPANTGVLLMGNAGEYVYPTATTIGTAPESNLLVGIATATEINDNAYYGLSGENFVKVNSGTVKAGKALLPASYVDGTNVKSFTFVFEGADGIKTVEHVSAEQAAEIFNLAGQRMSKPVKGVNIINGKKVLVK